MHPVARPSTVLALALAAVGAGGCPWGTCGDTSFDHEATEADFLLESDGSVSLPGGDVVDPSADGACEALCEAAFAEAVVDRVDSCELTVVDADPAGAADTDDSDEPAPGSVHVACEASGEHVCIGGRHHADLATRAGGRGPDAVAAWLAREAHGEAGSVVAFRRLAAELRAHGAPEVLVARAREAEQDEVRHARDVRALARARGGVPDRVRALPPRSRSLRELALENAVEGCVHETFAAARAGWQARFASDAAVRRVSAVLAEDEARHADLAADVHAWALSRLDDADARAVEAARHEAWRRLAAAPPIEDDAVRAPLGLPDAAATRRLVATLAATLGAAIA